MNHKTYKFPISPSPNCTKYSFCAIGYMELYDKSHSPVKARDKKTFYKMKTNITCSHILK